MLPQIRATLPANTPAVAAPAPVAAPAGAAPAATTPGDPSGFVVDQATMKREGQITDPSKLVHVRLLQVGDFHGQIPDNDAKEGAHELGGAATLAAYLNRARAENPGGTVTLSAGDAFGASPSESTLLDHESSMVALAAMGMNIATLGNHEFDSGTREMLRLILGGGKRRKKRKGQPGANLPPLTKGPWPGSTFPWISANVVDRKSGKPILPPYVIMNVNGVKVAFVGAVTKDLKNVTSPMGNKDVVALDPAEAINKYVPEIRAQGVKAIVAVMHEGGDKESSGKVSGPVVDIVKRLDKEVDVVLGAHTHKEYAAVVDGRLVVQGASYAKAFGQVELAVDPKTGDVVAGTAKVLRNLEKGIAPDPTMQALASAFGKTVAPVTQRVVSKIPGPVSKEANKHGEAPMGTLIAEAQRSAADADVALMNPGGIRASLEKGGITTYGMLFKVQPFANRVKKLQMSGAQLMKVLEQQFQEGNVRGLLQIAGMQVVYDTTRPPGKRIVQITMADGTRLDPSKSYTVAVNEFLANGGDGFTELKKAKRVSDAGDDLQALADYLAAGKPVPVQATGRITVRAGKVPGGDH